MNFSVLFYLIEDDIIQSALLYEVLSHFVSNWAHTESLQILLQIL